MSTLRVIQTLTAGVENFLPYVPDGVSCATPLACTTPARPSWPLALIIASGRRLD